MKCKSFAIIALVILIQSAGYAQKIGTDTLDIGDLAPPLKLSNWFKGNSFDTFATDRLYVIEFWATWCIPCIRAMPHLSMLAEKYKNQVVFLGVDVYDRKSHPSPNSIQRFVDSMGNKFGYAVAMGDSNYMEKSWVEAAAEGTGIPKAFVIDKERRIAWMGHPDDLNEILEKVLTNKYNLSEARSKGKLERYLAVMDDSFHYELMRFDINIHHPKIVEKANAVLKAIEEIVRDIPGLTYAPLIADRTFRSLILAHKQQLAYEYGKQALKTYTYRSPSYLSFIAAVEGLGDNMELMPEIYELGAQAYQMKIDEILPEYLADYAPKLYRKKADLYIHAKNKIGAVASMEEAIKLLKARKNVSNADLAEYTAQLEKFRKLL